MPHFPITRHADSIQQPDDEQPHRVPHNSPANDYSNHVRAHYLRPHDVRSHDVRTHNTGTNREPDDRFTDRGTLVHALHDPPRLDLGKCCSRFLLARATRHKLRLCLPAGAPPRLPPPVHPMCAHVLDCWRGAVHPRGHCRD